MKHLKYAAGYALGTVLGLGLVVLYVVSEVRRKL